MVQAPRSSLFLNTLLSQFNCLYHAFLVLIDVLCIKWLLLNEYSTLTLLLKSYCFLISVLEWLWGYDECNWRSLAVCNWEWRLRSHQQAVMVGVNDVVWVGEGDGSSWLGLHIRCLNGLILFWLLVIKFSFNGHQFLFENAYLIFETLYFWISLLF